MAKHLSPEAEISAEVEQGGALLSCFSSHSEKLVYLMSWCLHFCAFVRLSLFKMAPKCSTEVLSSIHS